MGSGRQLHLELLDERSHVLVGDNGTLILLDTENALVDMNLQVALYLTLATQTPTGLNLLAREVGLFGIEDFSPTLKPPSSTCTLHCPQEALPPQALGRKTPFSLSVDISELP